MGSSRAAIKKGFAIGALGLLSAAGAGAQALTPAQGLLNDPFVFTGGLFLVGTDITANLNGQSTRNPSIDFNDELGRASDASRGRIDASWRFAPRHLARFVYFNYNASQSRTLNRDITYGDTTFNAGGNLSSNTKYSVYELDYEYAFLKQPMYEVAGTFGVHYTDLSLKLTGNGTVTRPDGTTAASGSVTKDSNLPMPLPTLGIRGGWAVSPQVYLDGRLQYFRLSVDGYDGNWSNAHVGATWMFTRHWGVGLGYDWFTTHVDVKRSNFNGNLKLGYSGLQASVTGSF
jgi:hypothetical protein